MHFPDCLLVFSHLWAFFKRTKYVLLKSLLKSSFSSAILWLEEVRAVIWIPQLCGHVFVSDIIYLSFPGCFLTKYFCIKGYVIFYLALHHIIDRGWQDIKRCDLQELPLVVTLSFKGTACFLAE